VSASGKRWQASISYGGKQHYLGVFGTKEQAAHAYDEAARMHRQEAPLNFTSTEEGAKAAAQTEAKHAREAPAPASGPRARPASGFYGVSARGKRWKASISYGGKQHYLGVFDTKEQAAHAYDEAARTHKKEEAPLNFTSTEAGAEAAAQAEAKYAREAPAAGPRARPASGFYGVSANGKRWQADIHYGGKTNYLGIFDTKEQAAHAYDEAARRQNQTGRPLNFTSTEEGAEAAELAAGKAPAPGPRARPASGFYGVSAHGKRWQASIKFGGKTNYLGSFDTKEQAAHAYDQAARRLNQTGRPLNFTSAEEGAEAAELAAGKATLLAIAAVARYDD
jgi:hypothetical protein